MRLERSDGACVNDRREGILTSLKVSEGQKLIAVNLKIRWQWRPIRRGHLANELARETAILGLLPVHNIGKIKCPRNEDLKEWARRR
jgi:hypothetical protein